MSANKQVLVAYYSLTGNTARVATDVAHALDADVESLGDRGHGTGFWGYLKDSLDSLRERPASLDPIQRDPADYALTIIGTPVWIGRMAPAVRAYLQNTATRARDVAFFVTSGNTDVAKILPSLERVAKRKAIASAGFSGHELADKASYDGKIAAFVDAIRSPRPAARSAA